MQPQPEPEGERELDEKIEVLLVRAELTPQQLRIVRKALQKASQADFAAIVSPQTGPGPARCPSCGRAYG